MYDQIAHYYDLTHADLTDDIPLLMQMAAQANGRLLELGCGSGRLLLPLAKAGYQITGVDSSPAMLERAAARIANEPVSVQQRIELVEGDMVQLGDVLTVENGRFAFAIIPYNTFMHLTATQAQRTVRQIKPLLAEGGMLIVDMINPFAVAATPNDHLLSLENTLVDPESGDMIVHMAANRLNDDDQILHITWIYDRSPVHGGAVHRTVAQAEYHYQYPHQIELLLTQAGFRVADIWGDYAKIPFDEESERLIVTAIKERGVNNLRE